MNTKKLIVVILALVVLGLGYFGYKSADMGSSVPQGDNPAALVDENALLDGEPAIEQGAMSIPASDPHAGHDHGDAQANGDDGVNVLKNLKSAAPLTVQPILGIRAVGDPNAPVKITELFSLTCGHCAEFHNNTYPSIKSEYVDTGKVYYVYQEFPLNKPALDASMIARCLPSGRYAGFIDLLFKNQDSWALVADYKSALRQNAKLAGMSDQEFDACLENKELQDAFAKTIQDASVKWQVKSTPTIAFNDGEFTVSGAQKFPAMKNAIDQFLTRAQAMSAIKAPVSAETPVIEEASTIVEETVEAVQPVLDNSADAMQKAVDAVNDDVEPAPDKIEEQMKTTIDNIAQ